MKKAVISTGGKQYLVSEGETLAVELLNASQKTVDLPVLLKIDDDKTTIGQPLIKDAKVVAEIVEPEVKAEKIVAIRYKAKKRVKKVRGHRQRYSQIKIKSIV